MKKILIILMVLACFVGTAHAALTYGQSNYDKHIAVRGTKGQNDPLRNFINEVDGMLSGTSSSTITNLLFSLETGDPVSTTEGRIYYNTNSNLFKFYNGGSWVNFAAESGTVSLDVAYDNGNTIDVDGSPVTLDNDTTDENVLLVLTQDDTTSNNDAMTIVVTGTGDALQITGGATTGGGINVISYASGIAPLITVDGSTNNWDGADDKGQILIQADDPYIHIGATALMVLDSSTPISGAEGYLARFVHSGTAQTNAYAVEIEVPATQPALFMNGGLTVTGQASANHNTVAITGNDGSNNKTALTVNNEGTSAAVIITCDDTDTPAMDIVGKASSTVTLVTFDGDTGDWVGGADDVAMVEIIGGATANANAGGGMFAVISAMTPAASSEGFLARFIHTGTATGTAHAVEIECTNAQPALMLNNRLTITGIDSTGVLFALTGNDDTGDTDVMTIANGAASDGIEITNSDVLGTAINCISAASQTTSTIIVDGATGNWIGADDVGMLHIVADTQNTHVGATNLFVQATYSPVASSEGFLARFEQKTGAAVTTAYAVEIETTATTPCLMLNGQMSILGQGATDGVLLDIVSADTDDDTVQLTGVGTGDVLQLIPDAAAAVGLRIVSKVSGTTSDAVFDATPGWIGADDIGLVHIESDSALTDNGATLLMVLNTTGQIKDGAEGHLARFVDTAAARTGSHAVEIETTNTTPCLKLNNKLTITGADSAGTLVAITAVDLSGNSDTMTIQHGGTEDAIQITVTEPTGNALNLIADAAQTGEVVLIDGTTGAYLGADDIGMLMLTSDGALAHVDASLLRIANTGVPADNAMGSSLRIVDTGNASSGTGYAVYISATDTEMEALFIDDGDVLIDDSLTATKGLQVGVGETMTTASSEGATQQIDDGVTFANVTTTTGVNEFITLPNDPPIGTVVYVMNNAGANFEIRTFLSGNDFINNVDTSDGATEYLCTSGGANNGDLVCFTYVTADRWIGVSYTYLGAVRTAVVPD